jgi:hypothetical protein
MPGYKSLPEQFSGPAAEQVRLAELLQRAGANEDAVHLLESALEVCVASSPELPGWLCGRLASMYRMLKRYDDEVGLLVRYRDSQQSEEARVRFDARLSKARAIAERKGRSDTRMLASVRTAVNRRAMEAAAQRTPNPSLGFTPETLHELASAFATAGASGDTIALFAALVLLDREARAAGHPAERIVTALKTVWQEVKSPDFAAAEAWNALYRDALTRALALYFDEHRGP